jgi:small subunit ribosomal protein S17
MTDTNDITGNPDSGTVATSTATGERSARKVREGIVTSSSMDKTITVTITERVKHAKYAKIVQRDKKLYAHDETNDAGVGDKVRIMETRPLSKNKRWRLVEILERAR